MQKRIFRLLAWRRRLALLCSGIFASLTVVERLRPIRTRGRRRAWNRNIPGGHGGILSVWVRAGRHIHRVLVTGVQFVHPARFASGESD